MITKQSLGKVAVCLKGIYSDTTQYEPLDLVSYEGGSYLAIQEVIGIPPTGANNEYWQLIAVGGGGAAAIDEDSILYWPDV